MPAHTILLSVRAPVGSIAKTNYDVVLGRGFAGIIGPKILVHYLEFLDMTKYWSRMSSGSVLSAITGPELKQTSIYLPGLKEQSVMDGFFNTLDSMIAAAERQRDLLKKQKWGFLQKMFPYQGNNRPQLRFKGFTDPWEQRQLKDVADVVMGQSPNGSTYSDSPSRYILVQGNSDIQNGYVSPRQWTTQKTREVPAHTILLSVRAPVGSIAKTNYDVVLGRGFAGIIGPKILVHYLEFLDMTKYWSRMSSGSVLSAITGPELKQTSIYLPGLKEQSVMDGFFNTLDSMIAAAEHKIDLLRKLKKAYLQQMFI